MLRWLVLAGAAHADPQEILAQRLLREAEADCMLGRRPTRSELAACLARTPPPIDQQERWALLVGDLGPEFRRAGGVPAFALRPGALLSAGPTAPVYADGDEEPGVVSARLDLSAWAGTRFLDAEVEPGVRLDLGPWDPGLDLPVARATLAWKGLSLELGQRPRWYGPDHAASLAWTDNARPLPGGVARAEGRLPGWGDRLGRFALDFGMGVIPGERKDADHPGWLLMDLRWLVRPWFELSATRTSVFGGAHDGEPLPLDWGEVLLPIRPHTTDDPGKTTADTDERIFLDARLTFPLRRWLGLPVDLAEVWYQYAGENVYVTDGILPLPFIQGVASVTGGEVTVRPVFFGAERAVVEDDFHRWYTGHRVYHDGWTVDGRCMGFAWGGDAWAWTAWVGLAGAGPWVGRASFTHARTWQVADVVNDHVFVFPGAERRDLFGLELDRRVEGVGWVSAEATAGRLQDEGFVEGDDRAEWRLAVSWRSGALPARER